VRYLKAFAVGIASALIVLWFESALLVAIYTRGWTGAYAVTGWSILLPGLVTFAVGFYATVRRGRRRLAATNSSRG
jgi:hypothetical protein